ncbi:MAG: hypothetical protein IRY91_15440, partial [Gemmatimonadaceae bacterium]|nr:hypothetical protein [Gemmatimonadaceae bacterium]
NWGHQGSVSVDLSGVLKPGEAYEVRNAQNFFGAPVTSGTYGGGTVTLPITSITPPTSTIGKTGPSTGTELNVYVVLKK